MIKRGSLAKSVEESMIRTIEAIQWLSDPTGNADTPVLIESLECTSFDELEIQWLLFLFGKLYKMIQNNTDKSFQECLNVVESIVNLIRDVPHLIQQEEFEKSLVSCICMYMAASHGQTNGQYQPLCRSFINNLNAIHLLKLADLEYNQMTISNYSIPTSVLEEVIAVALEVSTSQFAQLKWKIRLVECKRMYEPEAATALITKYIESHDKKDTPEPNILFMISKLHVELAISMNECDKFDGTLFEYVFEMWAKWTSEKLVDEANKATCCLQLTIKFAHVNEIEPQRMQHMFIRLSNTFLIMGYSGRAGLALEMAKSYSGNDNGSFYISYANYLCDIESTEKWRCLFPKALDEALSSYRLLSTLLSKSETNSSALKKLTTPIQTSLLLDTLQRICDVYKLQGEPKPLEYYLKVGVDLARKSHSLHYQTLFLTLLADLEVRRDNLTQSKDYLQQVDSLRVSGDVFSTDDSLVLDAGKEYQRAESIIDELCNPGYTKDFEFQELNRHNFSNTTADDPKAFFEDSYSSFTQEIIEKLPSNITVVILSIDTKKNVLNIGRLEGHAANTIFRLPLTRSQTRDGGLNGNGLDYTSVSSEFDQIMKLNVETTSNAKVCITNQEKRKWVESRKSLDNRLHKLLKSIEKEWLAGFKGIFSTVSFPIGIINEFKLKLEKLIFENISQFSSKTRKLEFNSDLCKLILSLGPKTESGDLEDIIFYLLDFYQCQGVPVEYSEIDIEEHKLDQSFATDNHLVLILDKFSQKFPWESLPCMRSTSVSRLPNSSILKMQLSSERIVDPSKTFYLLNPSEDLIRTQNQFESHLDMYFFFTLIKLLDGKFLKSVELIYSPAVVGNLWDVTDIDFDRFSIKFLQNWGLFTPSKSKYYSICESLAMSRDECKTVPSVVWNDISTALNQSDEVRNAGFSITPQSVKSFFKTTKKSFLEFKSDPLSVKPRHFEVMSDILNIPEQPKETTIINNDKDTIDTHLLANLPRTPHIDCKIRNTTSKASVNTNFELIRPLTDTSIRKPRTPSKCGICESCPVCKLSWSSITIGNVKLEHLKICFDCHDLPLESLVEYLKDVSFQFNQSQSLPTTPKIVPNVSQVEELPNVIESSVAKPHRNAFDLLKPIKVTKKKSKKLIKTSLLPINDAKAVFKERQNLILEHTTPSEIKSNDNSHEFTTPFKKTIRFIGGNPELSVNNNPSLWELGTVQGYQIPDCSVVTPYKECTLPRDVSIVHSPSKEMQKVSEKFLVVFENEDVQYKDQLEKLKVCPDESLKSLSSHSNFSNDWIFSAKLNCKEDIDSMLNCSIAQSIQTKELSDLFDYEPTPFPELSNTAPREDHTSDKDTSNFTDIMTIPKPQLDYHLNPVVSIAPLKSCIDLSFSQFSCVDYLPSPKIQKNSIYIGDAIQYFPPLVDLKVSHLPSIDIYPFNISGADDDIQISPKNGMDSLVIKKKIDDSIKAGDEWCSILPSISPSKGDLRTQVSQQHMFIETENLGTATYQSAPSFDRNNLNDFECLSEDELNPFHEKSPNFEPDAVPVISLISSPVYSSLEIQATTPFLEVTATPGFQANDNFERGMNDFSCTDSDSQELVAEPFVVMDECESVSEVEKDIDDENQHNVIFSEKDLNCMISGMDATLELEGLLEYDIKSRSSEDVVESDTESLEFLCDYKDNGLSASQISLASTVIESTQVEKSSHGSVLQNLVVPDYQNMDINDIKGNLPVIHEAIVGVKSLGHLVVGDPKGAGKAWVDYSENSVIGSGVKSAAAAICGDMEEAHRLGKNMGKTTIKAVNLTAILPGTLPVIHEIATCFESLADVVIEQDAAMARQRWEDYSEQSIVGSGVKSAAAAVCGDMEEARRLGINMGKATAHASVGVAAIGVTIATAGAAAPLGVAASAAFGATVGTGSSMASNAIGKVIENETINTGDMVGDGLIGGILGGAGGYVAGKKFVNQIPKAPPAPPLSTEQMANAANNAAQAASGAPPPSVFEQAAQRANQLAAERAIPQAPPVPRILADQLGNAGNNAAGGVPSLSVFEQAAQRANQLGAEKIPQAPPVPRLLANQLGNAGSNTGGGVPSFSVFEQAAQIAAEKAVIQQVVDNFSNHVNDIRHGNIVPLDLAESLQEFKQGLMVNELLDGDLVLNRKGPGGVEIKVNSAAKELIGKEYQNAVRDGRATLNNPKLMASDITVDARGLPQDAAMRAVNRGMEQVKQRYPNADITRHK
ncbi:hypothetical protein HDV02_002309 [Globomyces sp. JEL0801]|nr:hypothetical protein HDV02_002309 [Globomyces sp. JEL0801]